MTPAALPDGPLLWFLNRGTGIVLLATLTLALVLGVLATRGEAGRLVPRFLVQTLHRRLALLSTALLVVHVTTAVADEYVDLRWSDALVPGGAAYEPLWTGLGAVALDLVLAVVLTSLVRRRLPHRAWQVVHLGVYAAWALGVAHGLGMGTDSGEAWARWTYVASVALVAGAVAVRLTDLALTGSGRHRRAPGPAVTTSGGVR